MRCVLSRSMRVSAVSVCGSGRLCGGGALGGVRKRKRCEWALGTPTTLVHNTRKVGEQHNLRGRDL